MALWKPVPTFLVEFDGYRQQQVRPEGGDCSSNSHCYQ